MINWAIEFWYLCLAALLIGMATAAWIWLRLRASDDASLDTDEPIARKSALAAPAKPLEPVKPVIDIAAPVAFTATTPAVTDAPAPPATAAIAPQPPRPAIAAAVGAPDDLTLLKGVGPKLNTLLISLGVVRFDQIAAWGAAEIAEVDGHLGNFKGRIVRDNWVEQAGLLARGDTAGFAAKFGALGSEN